MKDIVDSHHDVIQAIGVAHIVEVETQLGVGVGKAHVVLFFSRFAKETNLADLSVEKATQDGVAEGAGAAGDEKCFSVEHDFVPVCRLRSGLVALTLSTP